MIKTSVNLNRLLNVHQLLYMVSYQEINQDNDIVNTITGNNNTVTNNQDNSISR